MRNLVILAASILAGLLLMGGGCLDKIGKGEKPAAVVNGEPITRQELDKVLEARFGKPVIKVMITERLVLQEGKKKNVTVTDEEIAKKVSSLLERPEIAMRVKQNDIKKEDLDRDVKLTIVMKKLINLEVKDDDRKAFYEQRKKDLAQIKVSHILVKTKPEAERILKEIKAGGDFAAAAKKESLDPGSKDKGGDIGFITESSSLVPEFKKAAMALKPGELSGVVKSQYGYHIIKATEQKKTYEELKDTIEELMAIQRQAEFLKRLEDQAKIENNL